MRPFKLIYYTYIITDKDKVVKEINFPISIYKSREIWYTT